MSICRNGANWCDLSKKMLWKSNTAQYPEHTLPTVEYGTWWWQPHADGIICVADGHLVRSDGKMVGAGTGVLLAGFHQYAQGCTISLKSKLQRSSWHNGKHKVKMRLLVFSVVEKVMSNAHQRFFLSVLA